MEVSEMLIPIGKITKELAIEAHQLREWEKRDWLGVVLKDPDNNNQRVYNDHQIERVHLIHEIIQKQREKGFKRTDFTEVEEKLFEKFGGEVTKRETEMIVHPGSVEKIIEMIGLQQKLMLEMQQRIESLQNKEIAATVDHSRNFEEMQNQLKFNQEREEKLILLIEKLQDDVEKLEKMPKKSRWKFWVQ